MKKINKIHEEEERRRKEFTRRMEYEKHKRGITKRKEDYEEAKARRYVKNINEMYNIISPEKHIEITEGTKNEGKKYCSTKSQWKYNREELEKQGKVKPEIEEVKENMTDYIEKKKKEIVIPRRTEKIFLIIEKKVYIKDVEIEPYKKICYGKIKIGKEKHEIELEHIYPEEKEIYETDYGEMTGKMLLEISIKTGVEIYELK